MAYCSPAGISWQKCQQEKAHPRPFRAPTRRCCLSFQQKCAAFKSTVKSLPVFVWCSTNSNQRFPFLKGNVTHRFRHFVCILSLLSRMSQTELIQWSQQKTKLFPIGWRPRARSATAKASPQISSRSRRQRFTFRCFFVAQTRSGGPIVVSC